MINYEVFEPLVNHLKSIGPFLFRPNSGNGGDAVIALSCMEIFDTHGPVSYTHLTLPTS